MVENSTLSCCTCGKRGIKLWRRYQVIAAANSCSCLRCLSQQTGCDTSAVYGIKQTSSGEYVPAIPRPDVPGTYHGHTSEPEAQRIGWELLPAGDK